MDVIPQNRADINAISRAKAERLIFDIICYVLIGLAAIFCLLPFWLMLIGSFTKEIEILQQGYSLWPSTLSLDAYEVIFNDPRRVFTAYRNSFIVTGVGTFLAVWIISMLAYPISLRDLKGKNAIAFLCFLTMIFSGGMAPLFIVVRNVYGLTNTYWAMILPPLLNVFWMFVLRNFFRGIPDSVRESALIDGAGEWTIFIRIILPLAIPGIATITLFQMLFYWNDWFPGLLFIDDITMEPLPLLLYRIISSTNFMLNNSEAANALAAEGDMVPAESVKLATSVLAIGPIVFVYPFIQRYFIKGITLGSIKG